VSLGTLVVCYKYLVHGALEHTLQPSIALNLRATHMVTFKSQIMSFALVGVLSSNAIDICLKLALNTLGNQQLTDWCMEYQVAHELRQTSDHIEQHYPK
jgi:hypothetical protein